MRMRVCPSLFLGVWLLPAGAGLGADPWTLERAIDHALTNSPDAAIAVHRIAAARAGLDQANAAFWPQLQFQSSYLRTDNPATVFASALNQQAFSSALNFNDVPDADNLNVRGLLTMPLYRGGQSKAGREAARATTAAAGHHADAVRNILAFEVARSFHVVLKTREFVRATEAAVASFDHSAAIARHRFEAGTLLKTELLDVEVRLAQAREDLVRARNANALSERALRRLLGIEQGDFTVADHVPAVDAPTTRDYHARPEVAAVRQQGRAAEAEVRRAKGGFLPRVNAYGSLDYDSGWKLDGDSHSYTVGVAAEWDLWDGRLTRGRLGEARANLNTIEESERGLRLAIDLEVEQARLGLEEATERLAVTAKSIEQAGESVSLTRARFEQGLALSTQLIDAETMLTTARVRRAEAEADRRIAVAALRRALGLPQIPTSSNR
jgi:outer membrane protein TolC